jgi:broad specificity phosphatase PhoE
LWKIADDDDEAKKVADDDDETADQDSLSTLYHTALTRETQKGSTMTAVGKGSESSGSVVIVVRHGERLDYVTRDQGGNWLVGQDRPFDSPLTAHGLEQASKLGKELVDQVKSRNLPPIAAIYTSPLLRCRQTSANVRRSIVKALATSSPTSNENGNSSSQLSHVKVEPGLFESLNESWYRSWSLPGSDGTWGFGSSSQPDIDPQTLHPLSKVPIQDLLNYNRETLEETDVDLEYAARTSITEPYCFHPEYLESTQDQRNRMRQTVERLCQPNQTIIVVSHGGPVTHLYEDMTGNDWQIHGESSYCCYSIYKQVSPALETWEAVAVNESNYLGEKATTECHV